MPQAQQGFVITSSAQLAAGVVTSAAIALDTIAAADVADNAIGNGEIAAHTTTKITLPEAQLAGPLAIARGGTGQTTQTPAFDALSPLTTQGDVMYHNGTDNVRLAPGTSGQFLKTQGAGANPVWSAAGAVFNEGVSSRAGDAANGTQTIAHGLTGTPTRIKIWARKLVNSTNAGALSSSFGIWDGTNYSCVYSYGGINTTNYTDTDTAKIIHIPEDSGGGTEENQTATVAVDGTNITLTWTKLNTPVSANIFFVWEAML